MYMVLISIFYTIIYIVVFMAYGMNAPFKQYRLMYYLVIHILDAYIHIHKHCLTYDDNKYN